MHDNSAPMATCHTKSRRSWRNRIDTLRASRRFEANQLDKHLFGDLSVDVAGFRTFGA
jgi:hypothetical protein